MGFVSLEVHRPGNYFTSLCSNVFSQRLKSCLFFVLLLVAYHALEPTNHCPLMPVNIRLTRLIDTLILQVINWNNWIKNFPVGAISNQNNVAKATWDDPTNLSYSDWMHPRLHVFLLQETKPLVQNKCKSCMESTPAESEGHLTSTVQRGRILPNLEIFNYRW